ncbi:hypothetical protein NDU88_000664 [Pleurodeles waltl]|uniref:Uncharacterized protein n=1 Tax=Pleurodeles waltl TaxID=8319 RepID=A0AAV7LW63_PLEWA|nr:hypothetical protein NDU88_000664 [Pleurodeles waltl]
MENAAGEPQGGVDRSELLREPRAPPFAARPAERLAPRHFLQRGPRALPLPGAARTAVRASRSATSGAARPAVRASCPATSCAAYRHSLALCHFRGRVACRESLALCRFRGRAACRSQRAAALALARLG